MADNDRAAIVLDTVSTVQRMDPRRLLEEYLWKVKKMLTDKFRKDLNVHTFGNYELVIQQIAQNPIEVVDKAWGDLIKHFEIVSPAAHRMHQDQKYQGLSEEVRYQRHLALASTCMYGPTYLFPLLDPYEKPQEYQAYVNRILEAYPGL